MDFTDAQMKLLPDIEANEVRLILLRVCQTNMNGFYTIKTHKS